MVRTRAGAKMGTEGNAVERELEQPGPSHSPADAAAAGQTPSRPISGIQTPPMPDTNIQTLSRPVSRTSSRSPATVVARKLAAEALHARRMAELEQEAAERVAALEREAAVAALERKAAVAAREREAAVAAREREAAELELQAELAAIDADASHRSSRSSRSVNDWLQKSRAALKTDPVGLADPVEFTSIISVGPSRPALVIPTAVSPIKPADLATTATNANMHLCSRDSDRLVKSLGILIDNVNKGACHRRRDRDFSLPFFDGKSHLEWLSFKRAFLDTMDSHSAVENLARLNKALKGCAREAVRMLLATAREPGVVLRALDTRFGRPELIVAQEAAAMRALPRVFGEGKDLAIFASRVRNCVEAIRLLDQPHYLTSPELIQSVISKVPPLLRAQWVAYAGSHAASGLPMLVMFADFLADIVELQSKFGLLPESAGAPSSTSAANSRVRDKVHAVVDGEKSRLKSKNSSSTAAAGKIHCVLCQQQHSLTQCDKFLSLSVDDKWHFIKKKRICHRCLKEGWHRLSLCSAKSLCDIGDCKFRHHRLLHSASERAAAAHVGLEEDDDPAPYTASSAPCASSSVPIVSLTEEKEILSHASTSFSAESPARSLSLRPLLKVVAVTVSGPSGSVDTYALLDDGSTATFIDAEVAAKIGVKGPEGQVHVDCIGGLNKNALVRYVDFYIKGRHAKDSHLIRRARSIGGLGVSSQFVNRDAVTKYPYLVDLADELCYGKIQPMLIIGIDNWHLTVSRATRKGSKSQPVAIRTALGWVLFGFGCSSTTQVDVVSHATLFESATIGHSDRSELEQLIKEQYKLESIGISKREARNADDERASQIIEHTARRLPSGRFEVGLIWKSDVLSVPDSYNLAFSRFLGLEKKLCRDGGYAERYRANVLDMVGKGYAELCPETPTGPRIWYLPHFGVVNPNKPNKLRVVHDAAARSEGVSLNSLLLTGPDLLQPLLGILFRFREGKIGLTADIREMFPQIKIRAEDRDAQRFLWRDSPREPLRVYRMSSMMFGAASSPFTAIYIKNKNAAEHQRRYPDAARTIICDHYMDDCICSLDSVDEAAKLAADIHAVHKNGGFEMRGWASNSASALTLLPKETLLEAPVTSPVDLGHLATPVRTLGLIWQPTTDCVGFNIGLKKGGLPKKLTKRVVLAHVMRVFDPLGILAPLVVTGRIMFQNAWRRGLEWDEELSQQDSTAWRLWFQDLFGVAELQIPRCYCLADYEVNQCELHVFSDASESAFAAVAYWRFVLKDGEVKLALICSKVRVAPLKPVSIPRLELQGALIAARLASTICDSHRFRPVRQVFWCDSMTVLSWLRSEARSFKPFVSHRVGEILELTNASDWRWVPSELNVADDATRLKRTTLSLESRWITGPEFLLSSDWPSEPCISSSEYPSVNEESRNPANTIAAVHLIGSVERHVPVSADPKRFSSWLRLVRTTYRAHKYLTQIRIHSLSRRGFYVENLVREQGGILTFSFQPSSFFGSSHSTHETAADMRLAETHILRQAQLDSFPDELLRLSSLPPLPIPRTSRLFRLSLIVDEEGLLRLSSRITAASGVPEATKNPIVLDGKHPAVQLLVNHHHRRAAHANTETVVNELRQSFYLLGLRNVVRSVAFRCQLCRIRRAEKFQPPTGNLPEARLAHHKRPFTFTGLDYFGPVQVTNGRRREKKWVALYTCLVVRAIHLDVVGSLSTDSAVMSLRRFVARRGTPSEIWSDNGTAFIGARRELRSLYGDAAMEYAATEKISWRFIPPSAPFMGGVWERLVRSVKTALRATLTERAPTEEVLRTVLAEAEGLINSRPLTHVSVEPGSEEALTPNHFLLAASSGRPVPATLTDRDLVSRSGWRKAVRLADHFWQRWVKEYLPNLIPRSGQGDVPELAVGDLVLVADGNLPRGSWPRGRISATYPGRDGVIRVADVRTAAGTLRRPLKKLLKLRA